MDWLSFTAALIDSLAWPLATVVILSMLRRPLTQLIPLLRRLKFKDLELDFERKVHELVVQARGEVPAAPDDAERIERVEERFAEMARVSPRAAVLESWVDLEDAAIAATKRHGLELTSREVRSPKTLGSALEEAGILDDGKMGIYHRLRNLRNAAAHASDFSFDTESAIEYAGLASRLAEFLSE